MSGYDFQINFIKGSDNGPADALSHVLYEEFKAKQEREVNDDYSYLNYISDEVKRLDLDLVRLETSQDELLKRVVTYTLDGWPSDKNIDSNLQAFKNRQLDLSVEKGCLSYRLVIPAGLRAKILDELHSVHQGIVKMKSLARSLVWWPKIDRDIENAVKSCKLYLEVSEYPPKAMLHMWQWPERPNERLHADFCGPIDGHMYLVITDAFSKWVDIKEMPNITTATTIKAFAVYFSV